MDELLELPVEAVEEGAAPPTEEPNPLDYDRIIVAFSGGKDSLACLLHLLDLGVPRERIELHHHLVDGREGSDLMDWPVTEAYCEAIARAFRIPISYSWRVGGFEGEMLRNESATAAVSIPDENGGQRVIGGDGPAGTRLKFPQVSPDLSVRWCSGVLKIDAFARYLNNHPKFTEGKTLVLTGERAEESRARANYARFEPHRCDLRHGKRVRRHIDVWRAVHAWSEKQVWDTIARWRVLAHPSYHLGYSRCSCIFCVFGSKDQWASGREIAPKRFEKIATYERTFNVTIHRKEDVVQRADAGTPYAMDAMWIEIANRREFNLPVFIDPWTLPKGAFGESCGPS